MSDFASDNAIRLPAILDLSLAADLKQQLEAVFARGERPQLDASEVLRIASPCLQVLIAAAGKGAQFSRLSPAFREAVATLALAPALRLQEMQDE